MMKAGDLVDIFLEGKGSGGEHLRSCLVLSSFHDPTARMVRDNNSRWIVARVLVGGSVRLVHLYWDDEYEIVSHAT